MTNVYLINKMCLFCTCDVNCLTETILHQAYNYEEMVFHNVYWLYTNSCLVKEVMCFENNLVADFKLYIAFVQTDKIVIRCSWTLKFLFP